ncbi:hypothetical protein [Bacillus subtilis]|uniref:hypothetical protein n=1 Tax=Bacillus subtilis TaxID=1423 RepID=UPI00077E40EE|nr:hypothetical protein [Bacillus subtilis]AMR46800.1 hypothetical protein KHRBS_10200 [Bacillus subtilis subsp. subtilis]MBU8803423.1 hypothetical protein [Bacillus subtilis]MED3441479.1 hypothetical protein [Bacillus subtilis]MED3472011.1 hypothetical protein [Bacillus subtilis]CAF1845827.1 hypothetical protein NRS6137_03550 [Bacillus subtilis]
MASKKLNLSLIEESVNKYDKKEKVQLTDDVHVFIYPYFSPSRLTKMLTEMISDQQKAEDKGIDFSKINTVQWVFFSIVKEFSDLGIPNDIKNKVKWYLKLVDSEFFPMIINSYPKESMKKLKDATEALEKITEDLLTMSQEEINKLILEKVEEIETGSGEVSGENN